MQEDTSSHPPPAVPSDPTQRLRASVEARDILVTAFIGAAISLTACGDGSDGQQQNLAEQSAQQAALVDEGKRIFRFDTFGDEAQWTDALRMHEVISAAVDPVTALPVGLKVDAEALPAAVARYPERKDQSHEPRHDHRTAQARCRGRPQGQGRDGRRQGCADAGRHHLRAVPFDRRQLLRAGHRQAARWLGQQGPEPGRHRAVSGGGRGDEGCLQRLGQGQVRSAPQRGRHQQPGRDSAGATAAGRGRRVFEGAGKCVACHSGALFTDANAMLHPPADSMAEPEFRSCAARSASRQYRTTPLKGAWQHAPYFHNGSAATLEDVAATYNAKRALGLSAQEIADLAEYLKSL